MALPTGDRNVWGMLTRISAKVFQGRDATMFAQLPLALSNESILALNAAGTGTVALIKADGSDVVTATTGLTIPTGQTLTIASGGAFVNSGGTTTTLTAITANGAISPVAGNYKITKAGVAAMTLAAPASDGLRLFVTSQTAFAHTITATGLLATGSSSVNVATFAAFAGASITLMSLNGKWNTIEQVAITFS